MDMVVTAIGIYFNVDRRFQTYILDSFPQYGAGLTKIEDNEAVRKQLNFVNPNPNPKGSMAPEIIPSGEWFNSDPLQISELRRKVI